MSHSDLITEPLRALLVRRAYGLCKNPQEAEDLAHQTILRLLEPRQAEAQVENVEGLALWLLWRQFLDGERKKKVRSGAVDALVPELAAPEPEVPPSWLQIPMSRVHDAMAMLPEHERRMLEMRELDGLKYREIAERLEAPEGTVAVTISRARHRVRDILIGWMPEELDGPARPRSKKPKVPR